MRLKTRGEPSIGGTGENLQVFLVPVDDENMRERSGKEKIVDTGSVCTGRDSFQLTVAKGVTYRSASGNVTSYRYLLSKGGDFLACAQVLQKGREWTLSNIFVRRDYRRQGVASALVERVRAERKGLHADSSLTNDGAAFMGVVGTEKPRSP